VIPSPPAQRAFIPGLAALLVLAAALRLARLADAWNYWAVDYASYAWPLRVALEEGRLPWTSLVGFHPPQLAILQALLMQAGAGLPGLFGLALACSVLSIAVGAIALRGALPRGDAAGATAGLVFAATMAVAPHGVHYGLELNNYPFWALGGALATGAAARAVRDEAAGRAATWKGTAGLLAAAAVYLHGHFMALPELAALGLAALLTRRWRVAGALFAAAVLAAPLLVASLEMRSDSAAFHNEAVSLAAQPARLLELWTARYAPGWALGLGGIAAALGAALALRDRRSRPLASLLLGALTCELTFLAWGFGTGALAIFQAPYWLRPAFCGFGLLALGLAVAPGRGLRVAVGSLLVLSLLPSLPRTLGALAPRGETEGAAAEIRAFVDARFRAGDVLLWYVEPALLNDEPRGRDPAFAALRLSDLDDWILSPPPGDGADPLPPSGYGFRFRNGDLCFAIRGLRADSPESGRLEPAILGWLAEDRRVHLLLAGLDPARPAPDLAPLVAAARARGAVVEEATVGGAPWLLFAR
jgi:hypothetical protein